MTTITIPASLDEAISSLKGIDRLLTAKEWEKAAIVATFVRLSEQGVSTPKATTSLYSCIQFAELGINGLKSKDTVRKYVRYWIEGAKREHPNPGEDVELPEDSFPPFLGFEFVTEPSTPQSHKPASSQNADKPWRSGVISTGSKVLDAQAKGMEDYVDAMAKLEIILWDIERAKGHFNGNPEAWFHPGTRECIGDLIEELQNFLTLISNPVPDDVSSLVGE